MSSKVSWRVLFLVLLCIKVLYACKPAWTCNKNPLILYAQKAGDSTIIVYPTGSNYTAYLQQAETYYSSLGYQVTISLDPFADPDQYSVCALSKADMKAYEAEGYLCDKDGAPQCTQ